MIETKFILVTKLASLYFPLPCLPVKRPKWRLKQTIGRVTFFFQKGKRICNDKNMDEFHERE
ncbi:hypothetical protein B5G10_09945 [Barnesiella sp. An55]|nr:hypothetical protein B5G10_09945 [Barnesiella sp. An55]